MVAAAVVLWAAGCSDGDKEARRRAAGPSPSRETLARVASASAGASQFGRCAACHTILEGGPSRAGPNLHGIMGRPVAGSSARFGYTQALQRIGGTWTPERMDAWLAAPQRFAPGNSMAFPGMPDPLDRADVIAYLQTTG